MRAWEGRGVWSRAIRAVMGAMGKEARRRGADRRGGRSVARRAGAYVVPIPPRLCVVPFFLALLFWVRKPVARLLAWWERPADEACECWICWARRRRRLRRRG